VCLQTINTFSDFRSRCPGISGTTIQSATFWAHVIAGLAWALDSVLQNLCRDAHVYLGMYWGSLLNRDTSVYSLTSGVRCSDTRNILRFARCRRAVPVLLAAHLPNSTSLSNRAMLYFRMLPGSTLAYDYQNSKESKSVVVTTEREPQNVIKSPVVNQESNEDFYNKLLDLDGTSNLQENDKNAEAEKEAEKEAALVAYLYELTMSAYNTIFQGINEGVPWFQKFLITVAGISQSALRVYSTSSIDNRFGLKSVVEKLKLDQEAWKRVLRTKEPLKEQYLFFFNYDCVNHLQKYVENFDRGQEESNQSKNIPLIRSMVALFSERFSYQLTAVNLFELAKNGKYEEGRILSQFRVVCLLLIRAWVTFHRWNSTWTSTADLSVHKEELSLSENSQFKSTFFGVEAADVTGELLLTSLNILNESLFKTTTSSSDVVTKREESDRETLKKSLSPMLSQRSDPSDYVGYGEDEYLDIPPDHANRNIIEVVVKLNEYTKKPFEAEAKKQIMTYLSDLVRFMELSIGAFGNNSGLDVSQKKGGGGHTPFTA